MKEQLIVCVMGQTCEKFLPLCLASVKDADKIVYCDGGSLDDSVKVAVGAGVDIIYQEYEKESLTANSKQRNFYLDHLKLNYPNSWILVLDADEVLADDGINKLKDFIQEAEPALYSIKMRHLQGDLAHEDATKETHHVPNRLFHVSKAAEYPPGEHCVLKSKDDKYLGTDCTTIWHLSYVPHLFNLRDKYVNHVKKSEIHSKEYLRNWYKQHLFGEFPKKQFNPLELPRPVFDAFGIDPDEIYFVNRGLEAKHFVDAIAWKKFFKPKNAHEWGCGRGPRVFAMNAVGIKAHGDEISRWAVRNKLHANIRTGDITELHDFEEGCRCDLVIAYDLLEHIEERKLNMAIDNLIRNSKKHILVSVPTLGDPNLESDSTHKIKKGMGWWKRQFIEKGCVDVPVPQHFLFRKQLFIMEVPK